MSISARAFSNSSLQHKPVRIYREPLSLQPASENQALLAASCAVIGRISFCVDYLLIISLIWIREATKHDGLPVWHAKLRLRDEIQAGESLMSQTTRKQRLKKANHLGYNFATSAMSRMC